MSDITIYHNPKCGTSRNTLALIRNSGAEPRVIPYLQTPPSRTELLALIAAIGTPVGGLQTEFTKGRAGGPSHTITQWVGGAGGRCWGGGRARGAFTKEDGEAVVDAQGRRVWKTMTELLSDLPQVRADLFRVPDLRQLRPTVTIAHAPRFLLLYGSLCERSFSRLLTEEAARLLSAMGAEVKIFNPEWTAAAG